MKPSDKRHAWLARHLREALRAAQDQKPGADRALYVLGWLTGLARVENAELRRTAEESAG